MRTIAVIPARFRSQRLPGKPLADIAGRPMVEHVYRRVQQAALVDRVLVATDDERVLEVVVSFGGECVMTSPHHPSGTDRIAEATASLDTELVANVQGDEPLISPEAIDQAIAACRAGGGRAITTLRTAIRSKEELWNPSIVKVVTDRRGFALYFSRRPIPFVSDAGGIAEEPAHPAIEDGRSTWRGHVFYYKHIGLYVYPKRLLHKLTRIKPSQLERLEKLEQLRALENGIPILVKETPRDSISVDTPEDLERVQKVFSRDRSGEWRQGGKETAGVRAESQDS
ncbi:MAG: 3-deoxy-manno-octulosonate cytidylyltransferase [Acidobacteriota bacterium]